ncbi:MAG: TlpA family protein disulfide reductase [Ignavibacteria bacterium]|nr:TlpA family protein disulfide reductase [Ignavibacteria bacterium]
MDPPNIPPDTSSVIYEDLWDWHLIQVGGDHSKLSDFKGKVLFLHLWATWCPPCVGELPEIQQLYDSLRGENIAFLMISNESEERIKPFLREHLYTFPVYHTAEDIPDAFSVVGIPSTFILDRMGTIRVKQTGAALWSQPKTMHFLRRLM